MKIFSFLIICSCFVSTTVLAQVPSIEGFTIGVLVEYAQSVCQKHKATWIQLPEEKAVPGVLYTCLGIIKGNSFFVEIFSQNDIVMYVRFSTNNTSLCKKVSSGLKNNSSCTYRNDFWKHCGDTWRINCYIIDDGGINLSVLDLLFGSGVSRSL